MNRFRFSVAALMGLVLVIALCLAAMRNATALWASLAFTITVSVLLFALLGVMFDRMENRRFWSAFALFGWAYVISVMGQWLDFQWTARYQVGADRLLGLLYSRIYRVVPPPLGSEFGAIVVWVRADKTIMVEGQVTDEDEVGPCIRKFSESSGSTDVRVYQDPRSNSDLHRVTKAVEAAVQSAGLSVFAYHSTRLVPDESDFYKVGHSLLALAVGLISGVVASYTFPRPRDSKQSPPHREKELGLG